MAPERERAESGERLERAIIGEEAVFTAADIAAETDITLDEARRLWRALGFAEFGDAVAFNRSDARAVKTLKSFVDSGAVDFDTAVNMTRGVGQTMSRLADWEVATLVSRVEELEAGDQATGSRVTSAIRLIEEVNRPFEELLIYVWRRHLAAAVARVEAMGAKDEDLHTMEASVGFADIVSFTALSNRIDREKLGDLVEVFEARCQDVVSRLGGRIIKSLGDSVLFLVDDADTAVEISEGIINVVGRDKKMPDIRVGVASGPVIQRLGDVFGPPVNMAARLTAVARRNRIIIDQKTADRLNPDVYESRRLTARPVRGFGLVEPLTVRRR
ncbi:MAG: adenylate/guanylate cyclase domain-containing protein [Nocardioides sp.]|uniref:adenylate/guanylate cyclase domain-containing protein n=1 Tax=Nocardioides sp. TaxID=35761 RepID=UPI003F0E1A0C